MLPFRPSYCHLQTRKFKREFIHGFFILSTRLRRVETVEQMLGPGAPLRPPVSSFL